jgi:hypothetical protein
MLRRRLIAIFVSGAMMSAPLVGCAIHSGNAATPVAVASTPASAARTATSDGVIGILIGGELGADGGNLIGVQLDKSDPKFRDEAVQASHNAEVRPAGASDVKNSNSADLNHDGYVTLDELIAMRDAGISDEQMIRRLKNTGQVFELTGHQQNYLRDDAINQRVIDAMLGMSSDITRTAAVTDVSKTKQAER